jgi:hypothetical protein
MAAMNMAAMNMAALNFRSMSIADGRRLTATKSSPPPTIATGEREYSL